MPRNLKCNFCNNSYKYEYSRAQHEKTDHEDLNLIFELILVDNQSLTTDNQLSTDYCTEIK